MITSIQGILTAATPLHAIIELNGLGYEVNIPITTAEKLPGVGEKAKLHTLVVYREDSKTMYGFAATEERDFFRLMIDHVNGVGPKVALTIMSKLSLPALQSAISAGDIATLSKCPGIGKKTAERLVIELKSRVGGISTPSAVAGSTTPAGGNRHSDAVLALTALGYKPADADKAIRQAALTLGADASTEQLIKKALN